MRYPITYEKEWNEYGGSTEVKMANGREVPIGLTHRDPDLERGAVGKLYAESAELEAYDREMAEKKAAKLAKIAAEKNQPKTRLVSFNSREEMK